jgi:hypothetical protein
LKYQRLLKAATVLAGEVDQMRPSPIPGDPLDDAPDELNEVVTATKGNQFSAESGRWVFSLDS